MTTTIDRALFDYLLSQLEDTTATRLREELAEWEGATCQWVSVDLIHGRLHPFSRPQPAGDCVGGFSPLVKCFAHYTEPEAMAVCRMVAELAQKYPENQVWRDNSIESESAYFDHFCDC